MLDNASEYKSEEMMQFLESKGNRSHFSTPKEQWQNGVTESTINPIKDSDGGIRSGRQALVQSSFARQGYSYINMDGK